MATIATQGKVASRIRTALRIAASNQARCAAGTIPDSTRWRSIRSTSALAGPSARISSGTATSSRAWMP